jgi:5-methylcytosine-specific restriction enzyme subunit McrC
VTKQLRVVLQELDQTGRVHRLDDAQAAVLSATRLVEVQPIGGGHWRLLPAGRVGAVRADDLDVQVQPKTGIARLLFLLGYAADPGFRPEDVSAVAEPELWPALAESVARQVERALGPGVLQGYVSLDEALPLVRGRVRVADQIARRPGLPLPLEVRYDEYAPDIPENQLIRTALRRLAAVRGLRPDLRSRLAHLDGRLDGVHVLPAGAPLPAWRLTRLNARYAAALRLAEIVLRNQSAEPGPGGVTVAAFVVSMAKVFEDFVTVALQEALSASVGHTQAQYPEYLAERRLIPIRPDVVHLVGTRPVAVFDAKYKLEDPSAGYPNADAYQMLAYCTALQLERGWLVYAQGGSGGVRRIRNTSIEIIQYPLDLAASPAVLLRQVAALASKALALIRGLKGAEPHTMR